MLCGDTMQRSRGAQGYTIEKLLDTNAQMIRVCVLYNCRVRVSY